MTTAVATAGPQYSTAIRSHAITVCFTLAAAIFVAVGMWFRIVDLGRVPGINADEAWSGVQAERFLHGESIPLQTPTGNPLNVFFWGPEVTLHLFFRPSFALLRVIAVISGLAALAANYWLARRIYGQPTAALSTLLLTCLPTAIAYSRLGWDSSQTPLASALVIYLGLGLVRFPEKRRAHLIGSILTVLMAIVVHPTNVFLVPFVVICAAVGSPSLARWSGRQKLIAATATAVLLTVGHFLAAGRLGDNSGVFSPANLGNFLLNWGRLLSGATVYRYISGGIVTTGFDLFDSMFWLAAGLLLYGLYRGWRESCDPVDRALAAGYLAMLVASYVVVGPRALAPHYERYSMCLIVPGCLLLSRGAAWWWRRPARQGLVARVAIGSGALGFLLAFQANYFDVLNTTGGNSHLAFRTARVEPKQAAFEQILASSPPGRPVWIVSDNWWSFWPLAYLASCRPNVHVVHVCELENVPKEATLWRVELSGSAEEFRMREWAFTSAETKPEHTTNANGRSVVTFIRMPGTPSLRVGHQED